ncbi:MAG: ADP-ribosylglycohydrolase family protein, partial [Deltaproteobacteria bacterium]
YDADKLKKDFGRVDTLRKPLPDSYHPTKAKGEFTHYGDQAFVLLESVAAKDGFDLSDFSRRWQELFRTYRGYFDQATKLTLQNLAQGKPVQEAGSSSSDISGAARIAPLLFRYHKDPERLVEAARAQTRFTHNNPLVLDSAEFFARVCCKILDGSSPKEAMREVAAQRFKGLSLSSWVKEGVDSAHEESVSTIARFGQSCHTEEAFPGVVHLIAKYERDLREALVQGVMAGGDNAARGLVVGMVLGAHLGGRHLPEEWVSELKKSAEILRLLDQLRVRREGGL